MALQDVHSRMGPVNVTLYGKRDFADMIKVMNLETGDYTGLSKWAHFNHNSS